MTILACAALMVGAAAPARAATVSMPFVAHVPPYKGGGGHNVYDFSLKDDAGRSSRLEIDRIASSGTEVVVRGEGLTPGENCRFDPPRNAVVCIAGGQLQRSDIDLGDGNDEVTIAGLHVAISLGPGDDRLVSDVSAGVDGGPGADHVRARQGSITYAGRTNGVTVTPDGVANDGEPGEGDDVGPTFAFIVGGEGDDALHLPAEPQIANELSGRGGNDRLFGGLGWDRINGGEGDDALAGGGGRDQLDGGRGADVVRGGDDFDIYQHSSAVGIDVTLDDRPGDGAPGENDDVGSDVESLMGTPGADRIVGADGPNVIQGLGGDDFLDGRGGSDSIHATGSGARIVGGSGTDSLYPSGTVSVDSQDGERDEVQCGLPSGVFRFDALDVFYGCAPQIVASAKQRLTLTRTGTVRPLARCRGAGGACRGKLYLYRFGEVGQPQAKPIARARLDLPGDGRAVRLELRLVKGARAELAKHGRLVAAALWRTAGDSPPSTNSGRFDLTIVRRSR